MQTSSSLSSFKTICLLILVSCATGVLLCYFVTFDFCLLLNASLSVYKRVNEPSLPDIGIDT
jgi:hypothetical protein